MEFYPQNFGALVMRLAEEMRGWMAAQAANDQEGMYSKLQAIDHLTGALEAEGVIGAAPCHQIRAMALAAGQMMMCRDLAWEGLEQREEEFRQACSPLPVEISYELWQRTQHLLLAAATLTTWEIRDDDPQEERQRRIYERHGRAIVGLGKDQTSRDPGQFAEQAARAIPSTVVMFSGCQDSQTSADVFNVSSFGLPADSGPGGAGGACTSSMIKALHENPNQTWVSLLDHMRRILAGKYTQIPMLSSSRSMDLNAPFCLRHPESSGRFRALLVGINYVGQKGELRGCHNDVETMRRYIAGQGYTGDVKILLDDGHHESPTKANIAAAMQWLVQGAESGDSLFFHYSGHGASVKDDNGDEDDGMDEALVPLDYQRAGLLRDDQVFEYLVGPLKEGAWLTCVLDCCHSGTIMDLPYVFKADAGSVEAVNNGQVTNMPQNPNFDVGKLLQVIKDHPGLCAGGAALTGLAFFVAGPAKAKVVGKTVMDVLTAEDKGKALMEAAKQAGSQVLDVFKSEEKREAMKDAAKQAGERVSRAFGSIFSGGGGKK